MSITSNFVNYDRGVIKKEVKKYGKLGFDFLVDIIHTKMSNKENCSE